MQTVLGSTTPWVGHPHREGQRRQVNLRFDDDGSSVTATLAVWHYSPTGSLRTESLRTGSLSAETSHGERSSRPRLLLVHGFRGDHHGMQLIVNALPEFEVYVPDLPGFGETAPVTDDAGSILQHTVRLYAGVVDALAGELNLTSGDVLVGHSFGTIITGAHAALHSRSWAGMGLTAPISNDVFRGRLLPGAALAELYYRLGRTLPERYGNALLRSPIALEVMNLTMSADLNAPVVAYVRDQHSRFFGKYSDRRTLLDAYTASSKHTVSQYAEGLNLPVLLLAGSRDQLSTESGRRSLRDRIPQSRLEIIRGTGHLIHYERPAQVARALRRFIAEL